MIKATQIFGWEHEPAVERPSEFSRLSEFSTLGAFDPIARAAASAPRGAILAPEAKRAPPSGSDLNLSPLVPRWVQTLPAEAQPQHLCEHFPRIANRLALCWADPGLAMRLLDEFFLDKRGTRRGFPPQALNELKVLRQVALRRSALKAA